ncbi:MAG: D-tyrosyl-tRNA(Tyr) deacylase [Spirochaetaceae bacterium]|nr:MAG: D-tyrosyl-tRNA(Tyr) deacylase [Spirochaetaceae bacterium]
MRAVVQRVSRARVTVDDQICGQIEEGLLVYLGVAAEDGEQDLMLMADKVVNLRIFVDGSDKMNLSVLDSGGGVLVVSQFTLYGDARQGRRPSYTAAAEPGKARLFYERFVEEVRKRGLQVETGEFAARMEVRYTNVGPVTILLDSSKLF